MIKHPVVLELEVDGDDVYIRGEKLDKNIPTRLGNISRYGKQFQTKVLIAEIACENPNGYKFVKFKDGNDRNLKPSNLYWAKTKYNTRLKKVLNKKLTKTQVLKIVDRLNDCDSHGNIALDFNVSKGLISKINKGTAYEDITGIDASRYIAKGKFIRSLPNGKYAVVIKKPYVLFDEYEDAKKESTRIIREFFQDMSSDGGDMMKKFIRGQI